MRDDDTATHKVTLTGDTLDALEDLFPGALDEPEAIRMAVGEGIHRRRADRES
ncbi:MAG: hypothetical protein ABEJ76_04980 [Halanaeroarchaeum sp.]